MKKVIKLAKEEIGYLEKSRDAIYDNPSVLFEKEAGAGHDNYTKYNFDLNSMFPVQFAGPGQPWCAAFVCWCFYKAYGLDDARQIMGWDDWCRGAVRKYKNLNSFYLKNCGEPVEGDQIFFSSNGTEEGVHHTGLVEKVDETTVTTIEGNSSDGVRQKQYPKDAAKIYGYGRPLYEKISLH